MSSRLKNARALLRALNDRLELYCNGTHTVNLRRLCARNQQIWRWVEQHHDPDRACYLMVRLLYLAHKRDQEQALGRYDLAQLEQEQFPCLLQCGNHFLDQHGALPKVKVSQHALSQYSLLIMQGVSA